MEAYHIANEQQFDLNFPNYPYEDQEQDSGSVSDCESVVSGPSSEECGTGLDSSISDELVEIYPGDRLYEIIKRRFLSGLDSSVQRLVEISSIRRNSFCSFLGQAKAQTYQTFAKAVERKCGGNANLKYAWFGGSKDEIQGIISHGFSDTDGDYGRGVYLAPDNSSIDSVKSSIADEDGLKHVLLCRVILGKMEQVPLGSKQSHPSSTDLDSGVDNLICPNKYIIWSTHMNTHLLPEYIITFRAPPCLEGVQRIQSPVRVPTSPWMPFRVLIAALSKILPPDHIALIYTFYNDHRERKISRQDLIRRISRIAGDELLVKVIKSYRKMQDKRSEAESAKSSSS